MAAQETALDKYILTKAFTGKKWKPLSNMRLGIPQTIQHRKVSTKTLADVVEALVGAAFLDGGFTKALSCLRIFLPEVSWLTLAERNSMLLRAACDSPQLPTTPSNFAILETLIGHTFVCKRLLLEAVTHPSHLSIPSTPSYQRLEYLGDAILDYLVMTTIFSMRTGRKKLSNPSACTLSVPQPLTLLSLRSVLSHEPSQFPFRKLHHLTQTRRLCSFPARGQYLCLNSFDMRLFPP